MDNKTASKMSEEILKLKENIGTHVHANTQREKYCNSAHAPKFAV